jgi:bacterioferritin (cytochrome b1)
MNAITVPVDTGVCDIDNLNALLRGEISATETYEQALRRLSGQATAVETLGKIRDQHRQAAAALRERIVRFGGQPSEGSGIWGTFVTAVTGAANALGAKTALAALREGEEHGINKYENAIRNDGLDEDCKDLIRQKLLPQCEEHVVELDRLQDYVR